MRGWGMAPLCRQAWGTASGVWLGNASGVLPGDPWIGGGSTRGGGTAPVCRLGGSAAFCAGTRSGLPANPAPRSAVFGSHAGPSRCIGLPPRLQEEANAKALQALPLCRNDGEGSSTWWRAWPAAGVPLIASWGAAHSKVHAAGCLARSSPGCTALRSPLPSARLCRPSECRPVPAAAPEALLQLRLLAMWVEGQMSLLDGLGEDQPVGWAGAIHCVAGICRVWAALSVQLAARCPAVDCCGQWQQQPCTAGLLAGAGQAHPSGPHAPSSRHPAARPTALHPPIAAAGGPYAFDEEEEGGWTGESGAADDDGWVHYDTSNWCEMGWLWSLRVATFTAGCYSGIQRSACPGLLASYLHALPNHACTLLLLVPQAATEPVRLLLMCAGSRLRLQPPPWRRRPARPTAAARAVARGCCCKRKLGGLAHPTPLLGLGSRVALSHHSFCYVALHRLAGSRIVPLTRTVRPRPAVVTAAASPLSLYHYPSPPHLFA